MKKLIFLSLLFPVLLLTLAAHAAAPQKVMDLALVDTGTVKEITCKEGQAVSEGDTLVVLE